MPSHRQLRTALCFLAPFLLLTTLFFLYPLASAVVLAFQQTNGPRSAAWVGLSNFAFVLRDPDFYMALKNTTLYALAAVCLQVPLALGLALLLQHGNDRAKAFFRLAIFSPHLVGQIFVGVLFGVIFTPRYGLFNRVLESLFGWGLEAQWLSDPKLVMPALILVSTWTYLGFNLIYFMAALQAIDPELEDAARIDGAGDWQVLRHITLPAIRPVLLFVLTMSIIGACQLFELPYALLGGGYGPKDAGLTIVGYIYRTAFESGDLGAGSAIGWILALIILAVSLIQLRLTGAFREESS